MSKELFRKTLDPVLALAAIAVLDVLLFLLVGAWTVGGGETMMTGLMAAAVLGDDLQRILFWQLVFTPDPGYWKIDISLGMLFGAVVGAVASKELFIRSSRMTPPLLLFSVLVAVVSALSLVYMVVAQPEYLRKA